MISTGFTAAGALVVVPVSLGMAEWRVLAPLCLLISLLLVPWMIDR
jgi:hypothetical protein